jgi:hypothetical protein
LDELIEYALKLTLGIKTLMHCFSFEHFRLYFEPVFTFGASGLAADF